jgi:hypothetical protein
MGAAVQEAARHIVADEAAEELDECRENGGGAIRCRCYSMA